MNIQQLWTLENGVQFSIRNLEWQICYTLLDLIILNIYVEEFRPQTPSLYKFITFPLLGPREVAVQLALHGIAIEATPWP
jgi:hypothetical protein